MKSIKLISLAALTLLAFACTKEQEVTKDAVTLKSTDLTVGKKGVAGAAASAAAIEFTANNNWTATPSVDWITLDKTSGAAGDVTLAVTVAENDTYEERTGEVKIVCGEAQAKINITQTLKEVFGVAVSRTLGYEAQTITLAVGANVEYDVTINCGEGVDPWISLADTKAEPQLESISLIVEANTGNTAREAEVTIGNDDAMVQYFFTQESRQNDTEINGVAYLGNSQKPYDTDTWVPTTFAQYLITMSKTDGSETTLSAVINVNKEGVDKTVLPAGTFTCDAAATHEENTFSIKSVDDSEIAYTTIMKGENEVLVMDGYIEISQNEVGEYSIKCTLMDEDGNVNSFEYSGAIDAIEDKGIGSQVSTEFYADYSTHFAQAANEWKFNCYFSEAVPGVDELVYQLSFSLYGESGEKTMDQIPEGTYTFAEPGSIEGHPAGVTDAAPGTFSSSQYGGNSDYNAETGDYRYADITGGTITISNVDVEEHTFNIAYNLNIKTYAYNWETYVEEDVRNYDYQYAYENVKYIPSDSGMRPILDEDQEFTGCMMSTNYTSYWYGTDRFGISGTNIFWFGFLYVNNNYTVYIPISTNSAWTWLADVGTKCSTPIPDGTYEFSFVPAANCICNIGTPASRKGTITNGYTGSAAYITGGSITFSGNATHIDFNLTATIDGSKDVHYTGGFDTAINYGHTNNSAKSITWAPYFKYDVNAAEPSAMQIVKGGQYYKFPAHKYDSTGTFANFVQINQNGSAYYIKDLSKLPDRTKINRISVVTASNGVGAEDFTIPSVEVGAGSWFAWVTSQGSLINDNTTVDVDTEYTLTNDPSWGGNSSNIGTSLTAGSKYASILYENNDATVKWKLIEVTE